MDRLNRAGLNFNFLGSVRPETDYSFSRFFFCFFPTPRWPLNFNRSWGPVRLPETDFFFAFFFSFFFLKTDFFLPPGGVYPLPPLLILLNILINNTRKHTFRSPRVRAGSCHRL